MEKFFQSVNLRWRQFNQLTRTMVETDRKTFEVLSTEEFSTNFQMMIHWLFCSHNVARLTKSFLWVISSHWIKQLLRMKFVHMRVRLFSIQLMCVAFKKVNNSAFSINYLMPIFKKLLFSQKKCIRNLSMIDLNVSIDNHTVMIIFLVCFWFVYIDRSLYTRTLGNQFARKKNTK